MSKDAGFWDHVEDLRKILIKCLLTVFFGFFLSLFFYKQVFSLITAPIIHDLKNSRQSLILLSPSEGLSSVFKVSFWVSLIVTSPVWLFFIFEFVSPALSSKEKKRFAPFLFFSLFFCLCGGLLAYYVTLPIANQILSKFNDSLGQNLWSLSNYLDFTLLIVFSNALAFEFAYLLLFSVQLGFFSKEALKAKRKLAIVCIFTLSAVLTPPDIFTQIALAIPLIGVYELAIFWAKKR